MEISPQWYILCKYDVESSNHLFIHCNFIVSIWNYFFPKMGRTHVWSENTKAFVSQWYGWGARESCKVVLGLSYARGDVRRLEGKE